MLAVSLALIVTLIAGCGGGTGTGSMMLKITSPSGGAQVSGNTTVTATMLNPAVAATVDFKVNGVTFATVTPAATMTAQLDTLSRGLPDGPVTITVQTTGNVYKATQTFNLSNGRAIYVDDTTGSAGSYVPVVVKLSNFSDAAKCQFSLTYNANKLQLDPASVAKGGGIPSDSTLDTSVSTGLLTVTISGSTKFVGGDILVAHFQIRTPSPSGTRNVIGVSAVSVSDVDDNPLSAIGVPGSVTTN